MDPEEITRAIRQPAAEVHYPVELYRGPAPAAPVRLLDRADVALFVGMVTLAVLLAATWFVFGDLARIRAVLGVVAARS